MMSLSLTGELPFSEVYLHALIRDAHGRKMSKSLGNVIDPLDVIEGISLQALHQKLDEGNLDPTEVERAKRGQTEDYPNGIPECGTDALRFALLSYAMAGKDINLDVGRIVGYRFFCNKLWNVVRFALTHLSSGFVPLPEESAATTLSLSNMDRWVLARLSSTIKETNECLASYSFANATQSLYSYWLYDVCDVYVEAIKPVLRGDNNAAKAAALETLYTCVDVGLRLLHPMMPYVTEELWQRLPKRSEREAESVMLAPYPEEPHYMDKAIEKEFAIAYEMIKALRSLKANHMQPRDRPQAFINCNSPEANEVANSYEAVIITLAQLGSLSVATNGTPQTSAQFVTAEVAEYCTVHIVIVEKAVENQ